MARWTLVALLCVAVAGCGGGCSGSSSEESATSSGASQRTEASGGEADETARTEPRADPGPRPEVRVTAEVDPHARHVTPRVENHGPEARLDRGLTLERRQGREWSAVDAVDLALRFSCEDEAAECVTLAPGAVFIPPPWLGTLGDAQCACEGCEDAEPGTYRFVARSCGGGHELTGEPFDLGR